MHKLCVIANMAHRLRKTLKKTWNENIQIGTYMLLTNGMTLNENIDVLNFQMQINSHDILNDLNLLVLAIKMII